jgi:hypothetical protein
MKPESKVSVSRQGLATAFFNTPYYKQDEALALADEFASATQSGLLASPQRVYAGIIYQGRNKPEQEIAYLDKLKAHLMKRFWNKSWYFGDDGLSDLPKALYELAQTRALLTTATAETEGQDNDLQIMEAIKLKIRANFELTPSAATLAQTIPFIRAYTHLVRAQRPFGFQQTGKPGEIAIAGLRSLPEKTLSDNRILRVTRIELPFLNLPYARVRYALDGKEQKEGVILKLEEGPENQSGQSVLAGSEAGEAIRALKPEISSCIKQARAVQDQHPYRRPLPEPALAL